MDFYVPMDLSVHINLNKTKIVLFLNDFFIFLVFLSLLMTGTY